MSAPKVIDSLTHSFDVMVSMLFRPFDFGKWCLLGLVFFLAGLTEDISNLIEIPFQFLEYFIEDLEPLFEDPVALIMPGLMLIGGLMLLSFGCCTFFGWYAAHNRGYEQERRFFEKASFSFAEDPFHISC